MIENVLDLLDVFSDDPEMVLRIFQALRLDLFDLLHGVLLLFAPLQTFLQEVQNHKVKTP